MDINNRELALLIWIVVFVIGVTIYKPTRKTIPGLLKAVFQTKLIMIYGIMAVYTAGMVYFLFKYNLWDSSQIKNTVLWFLTVGLVSLNDMTSNKQINFFKKTIVDILGVTAIVQFVTGVYTFSFIAEFILIPIAALIGGMIAFAGSNPQHAAAKKLLNGLLILTGLYTVGFTIYKISTDFKTFASRGTLNDFLIPGALSLMFVPLVYVLALYASREVAFVGLGNTLSPKLVREAKWHTLFYFFFNKQDLQRWKRLVFSQNIQTSKEVRDSIKLIQKLKRIEKTPPIVPVDKGWSPYKAKEVLTGEGIITSHYQPAFEDEWHASSNYFKLNDDILANKIAYYITGNFEAAQDLKLVLDVTHPAKATDAHLKLFRCAKHLYKFAFNQDLPRNIADAIMRGQKKSVELEGKTVSVQKKYMARR